MGMGFEARAAHPCSTQIWVPPRDPHTVRCPVSAKSKGVRHRGHPSSRVIGKAEFILERKAFFHRFLAFVVLFFYLKNESAHSKTKPCMWGSDEKALCVRVWIRLIASAEVDQDDIILVLSQLSKVSNILSLFQAFVSWILNWVQGKILTGF